METTSHVQRTERFDLRALYESSRLLSASLDLDFVLDSLLLTALSKLLVTRGVVLLYDPLTSEHRAAAVKGIPGLVRGDRLRLGKVPPGRLLRGTEVPEPLAEHRIALVLPVSFGHREIGLIGLGKKATGQPFEAAELEFLQSLIHISSAAVHNSLMVEELKQANRDLDGKIQQLNTLFDLSQEFNATLDRGRLVKLLSFALMGQMLVGKYLFLLRHPHTVETAAGTDEVDFRVIAAKGVAEPELEPELIRRLCCQEELVLLQGEEAAPEWEGLRRRGLSLVLPLLQHGSTCGALCLGPKMTGQPYGPDDVEFLSALGHLAFVSIQNSHLVEEQIEKERLEEEMRLAREIQERLLPQEIPTLPGIEVATLARPSRFVGGDYLDVIKLEGPRLLLAVADVTGKGMPAALLMANLQACLHVLGPIDITLEDATARINRVICDNTGFDRFITFFHGIYDAERGRFIYVNAGHNPPMLVRADGEVELLEQGGLLLGVMRGASYERGTVALCPGDAVVLFTDGVTEAMSPDEEEYGEKRLQEVLLAHHGASAQAILDAVYADVRRFTDDAPVLSDDLTMIVLKVA